MRTIAKSYLRNRECPAPEAFCHVLSELNLRRILSAVYYANTNFPEEKVLLLLSEKELNKLPGDGPNNFKESNIKRFIEGLCATLCNLFR